MKTYYTDGFTLGQFNPSDVGGGWTITDEGGRLIERHQVFKVGYTNNEAELGGVIRCIALAEEGSVIYTDSDCACLWMKNGKGKRKDLNPYIRAAKKILEEKKISLIWVPREENLAGIFNENYDKVNGVEY